MIRLATVFSGIGAIEFALKKSKLDYRVIFACDNGERELNLSEEEKNHVNQLKNNIEKNEFIKNKYSELKKHNFVKDSYFANYDIDDSRWYEDIRYIDGKEYNGEVDLFVGGSPCQSFSLIGKRKGLEDARGTLFYEYARLVKEIQPKVFIYENVAGMITHDKGKTWEVIKNIFESLGYDIHWQILNAADYGIPQNRRRLFVVGFKEPRLFFHFPEKIKLEKTMFDFLEPKVDSKLYLGKKGFEFVTNPKNNNRAKINTKIIRTQKANQQFNWNGDFVFERLQTVQDNSAIMKRAYVGEWNGELGVIRLLSNRECLRLMGFTDDFKIVVDSNNSYRQSGNSIVVNVLQEIISSIQLVETLDNE
ncbi:MAG: DNA (cytosine-5-)-methyltransferase [Clostridia bacterium]|nr:DNA (cytosine-5-)-methyltransferase [Clostridia bacterium]